jgi:predicted nucleotidyltransferase
VEIMTTTAVKTVPKDEIEKVASEILGRYPVKKAALFGSSVRKDFTDNSDIDIIVEFSGPIDWLGAGLLLDLEEALGRSVDMITYDTLRKSKKKFREHVEKDAHVFYER